MSYSLVKVSAVWKVEFKRILQASVFVIAMLLIGSSYGQINPCALSSYGGSHTAGFKIDKLPGQYNLGTKSEKNLWLFQNLRSVTYLEYELKKSSGGRFSFDFPEADYVEAGPQGQETYLILDQGRWNQIAVIYPQGNGELPVRINFRRQLKGCLPASNARTAVYATSFDWQKSDDEDIEIKMNVTDARDASGKIYLPQGIFDAYRVERKVLYTSEVIGAVANTDFEDYTSYFYLDQDTEELLMEVRLELDGSIDWIKYKSTDEGALPTFSSSKNQFALYPLRSFGDDIRLDFRNFDKGRYSLIVYNVFGKMLWSQEYSIVGDTTIRADLSFLLKGTYTYRLQDANRNTLVARRLAIINP